MSRPRENDSLAWENPSFFGLPPAVPVLRRRWRGWMRRWLGQKRLATVRRKAALCFESLEDRLTPSGLNLMVTDASDSATDSGSLRYAINQVNADTTVGDADTITFSQSLANTTISLGSGLTLSNTTANLTITIDGTAAPGVTIAGTGASFSLLTVNAGVSATLTSLTINDGLAANGGAINNAGAMIVNSCLLSENAATANGGAIYNSGTLILNNTVLAGNIAAGGGGVYMAAGALGVFDCTLGGNTAASGGGIDVAGGKVSIAYNSLLSGNVATGSGGGIQITAGTLSVNGSTISVNEATTGAGIDIAGGTVTIDGNCVVSGNIAGGTGAAGGGVQMGAGILSVDDSTLTGNEAANGAGIDIAGGSATISNSTLTYNTATGNGGGIDLGSGTLTLSNDIVNNNSAGNGGGLYFGGGSPAISATTFSGNSSTNGGAVYVAAGMLAINNNNLVINSNSATSGGAVYLASGTLALNNQELNNNSATNGGCIYMAGGMLSINDSSSLSNNSARNDGGAIYVAGGTTTISNGSVIDDNSANGNSLSGSLAPGGGGIYVAGGTATISSSTVDNNHADGNNGLAGNGGGIAVGGGTVTVVNSSTIASNTAAGGGGGIYVFGGTLTAGNSTFTQNSALQGGAIQVSEMSFATVSNTVATVINCKFTGNEATFQAGGAIAIVQAAATVSNCTLSSNTADSNGGGIVVIDGLLSADNNTISGNIALDGGGVYVESGTVTVSNSTISLNVAGNGGGIVNDAGTVALNNSTVSGNTAAGAGGGICTTSAGSLSIYDSTIAGNTASNDQGGGIAASGKVTVTDSTIDQNTATSFLGGGIAQFGGTLTITNSTIAGNSGTSGGGIEDEGTANITDCTISGNTASYGGGIDNRFGDYSVTIGNTIVAGNTAVIDGQDVANQVTSLGYNLIGSASFSSGWTSKDLTGSDADPLGALLASPGDYGGPTQTMPPLPGSPALGNGNASATGLPATDQRGFPRTTDGQIDIGAVQMQANLVVTTAADPGQLFGQLSLREAVNLANAIVPTGASGIITFAPSLDGDTITLTQGVLALTGASSRGSQIDIYGIPEGQPLELGGNITVSGNMQTQVFSVAPGVDASISGLTIINGAVTNSEGGGIYFDGGTLSLNSCILSNNSATYAGGAIFIDGGGTLTVSNCALSNNSTTFDFGAGGAIDGSGTVTVSNSTFTNNSAGSGGAIALSMGTLTISNCTLSGNSAGNDGGAIGVGDGSTVTVSISNSTLSNNSAPLGGAIDAYLPTLTLSECTLTGNSASTSGGAVSISGGTLMVSDSSLSGNTAADSGGGIAIDGTTVTIANSTISGNSAMASDGSGAGISITSGTLVVNSSTLSGNSAANGGGGIALVGEPVGPTVTVTVSDSTLAGNSAVNFGGGIDDAELGTLEVSNSTISSNTVSTGSLGVNLLGGGGIYLFPLTSLTLQNSIVAGNNNAGSEDILGRGTFTDLGNNLLGSALMGQTNGQEDQFSDTPGLAPLNSYGGPTQTMPLLPGSPALGNGNASASGLPTTDERGFPRTVGGKLDIGAVETQASPLVVTTAADPGQVAGQLSLREAINLANALGGGTISFDISGSTPVTITPLAALPTVTASLTIDGTTEPGYVSSPVIVLDGASAGSGVNGLTITARNSTVRGLVIDSFSGSGIEISGSSTTGTLVEGNYIGTNAAGTAGLGNGIGVQIDSGAIHNTIGGTTATARNVISGNTGDGVLISGSGTTGNVVEGNYIGTNAAGTAAVANTGEGIDIISASSNIIGLGNVISGNLQSGVFITGAGANDNVIQGNFIGTNAAGTAAIGNARRGVYILNGAESNLVGTNGDGVGDASERNVISGNTGDGVGLGTNAQFNVVAGNFIGTDVTGTHPLGNLQSGIAFFNGASHNTIGVNNAYGAFNADEANIISGNEVGIYMENTGTVANVIAGNFVGTDVTGTVAIPNTQVGIDLTTDGVTGGPTSTLIGTSSGAAYNPLERNVISGDEGMGVLIGYSSHTTVAGNYIGTNAAGTAALANIGDGIQINNGSTNSIIGGTGAGQGNIIAYNTGDGVQVDGAMTTGNSVRGNSIFANGPEQLGPGIVLSAGGNLGLAAPTLTSATFASGKLTIKGSLRGTGIAASTAYTVEFFANPPGTSSSQPLTGADVEGKIYLGSTTVTTNAKGVGTISTTLSNLPAAFASTSTPIITATTSAPGGSTSAFSAGVADPARPQITTPRAALFTVTAPGQFTVTAAAYSMATLTESGSLPRGVTFDRATGLLSGTPAPGTNGSYTLHFTATNGVGRVTQTFILTVGKLVESVGVPTQVTVVPPTNLTLVSAAAHEYAETFTLTENAGVSLGGRLTVSGFTSLPSGVTFLRSTGGAFPATGPKKVTLTVYFVATNPALLNGLAPLVEDIMS